MLILLERWGWGSGEFEDVPHGQARLLRPVARSLRAYRQEHHRDLVVGETELAGHGVEIEADHRGRAPAERACRVDDRRRTEGRGADRFVTLQLHIVVVETARR